MAEEGANPILISEADENTTEKSSLETTTQSNKRAREEVDTNNQKVEEENGNGDSPAKKRRVEEEQNGVENSIPEALAPQQGGVNEDDTEVDEQKAGETEEEGEKKVGPVKLGPKSFNTSMDMFDYFYKFLHCWPLNLNVNKYEHTVLWDLLIQGHHESDRKVGPGVEAFQIRDHPIYHGRCYFLIRKDGTTDDFSYRKCVDSLLPLPENMKAKLLSNDKKNNKKTKQGGGWGGGRGAGGWGRGRHGSGRGRFRN